MTKRILIAALMTVSAIAQQTVTLTAIAPQGVTGLGSGIGGSAAAPGTGTACYWVVTNYVGGGILSSRPTCPTNVPATLGSTNYVLLTWQPITAPQLTFDVLKTTTAVPPLAGATVAIATGLTSPTYQDQGGSLSPYTITPFPYAQASAQIQLNVQDFTVPTFEVIAGQGGAIQSAFGAVVPKWFGSGFEPPNTTTLRLGSRTNPFIVDYTGAAFTASNPVDSSSVGTITGGLVLSTSVNLTTAQVNAGTVIVPAVTGQTFKVQRFLLQALGGSTGGCTLVEITDQLGFVAASATAGALTQNTVVTESTASGVTLTNFAPTALSASQGLQVMKTGSSCTTATSFNVIVYYTINS